MIALDGKNYDPPVAASASCASSIAMTAIDTTNLRLTVTVPAHGMLYVKLRSAISAGSAPDIIFGVMEGATVRGRSPGQYGGFRSGYVTQNIGVVAAEFLITGLTPGASITLDAAYAVEFTAVGDLKWGGPNDTTGGNAWGGFLFVIYDPRPLPIAAPGASGGVFIAGGNAATSVNGLSITNGITMSGNLEIEGHVAVFADGDDNAVTLLGSGTGHGLSAVGGTGGGNGIVAVGNGPGNGVYAAGGDGGGDGIRATATGADGNGVAAIGVSGGHGFYTQGGNANGDGINASTSGGGVSVRAADGFLGDLTGNLIGNVTGTVASVVGAVGSVLAGVTVGALGANAITAATLAGDVGTEIAAAVWDFAHESGRKAKGVLVRLDALMTGRATGMRSSIARFFRTDGTTPAIQATQNIAAGTRDAASSISGD